MGKIATYLRREIERSRRNKLIPLASLWGTQRQVAAGNDVQQLIRAGRDPVHAVYTTTVNLVSEFAEAVLPLPPMNQAHDFLSKWEEVYAPGFPPMSPISVSFYSICTLFDVPFGPDHETLADCFAALTDIFEIGEICEKALGNVRQSRNGIYEILGASEERFRLRELVSNLEFDTLITSGFKGEKGQFAFLRIVPPLHDTAPYFVGLTTPYVLLGLGESDWLSYFGRFQIVPGTVGCEERLRRQMKFGCKPTYWSEFIFYGYVNFRSDAIFLTGLPDRPETQPHHQAIRSVHLEARVERSSSPMRPILQGRGDSHRSPTPPGQDFEQNIHGRHRLRMARQGSDHER